MDSNDAAFPLTGLTSAPSRPLSPLARGIGYRLAWAGGLSAALWLAVYWALAR
jgi:hypothetical protein